MPINQDFRRLFWVGSEGQGPETCRLALSSSPGTSLKQASPGCTPHVLGGSSSPAPRCPPFCSHSAGNWTRGAPPQSLLLQPEDHTQRERGDADSADVCSLFPYFSPCKVLGAGVCKLGCTWKSHRALAIMQHPRRWLVNNAATSVRLHGSF